MFVGELRLFMVVNCSLDDFVDSTYDFSVFEGFDDVLKSEGHLFWFEVDTPGVCVGKDIVFGVVGHVGFVL